MAFVSEIISDEDKSRYDLGVIKRPPIYLQPVNPTTWTIDRERNAFLITTTRGTVDHQNLVQFSLWWNGDVIRIDTEMNSVGKFNEHVDIVWNLLSLWIPKSSVVSREDVIKALKEALIAYRAGVRIKVNSCSTSFAF